MALQLYDDMQSLDDAIKVEENRLRARIYDKQQQQLILRLRRLEIAVMESINEMLEKKRSFNYIQQTPEINLVKQTVTLLNGLNNTHSIDEKKQLLDNYKRNCDIPMLKDKIAIAAICVMAAIMTMILGAAVGTLVAGPIGAVTGALLAIGMTSVAVPAIFSFFKRNHATKVASQVEKMIAKEEQEIRKPLVRLVRV